ncbi:MAG: hypothetical protein EZS28_049115 [Streblomastix strix]|uniref:Uncharacterized protein n=1 Tax=Streblomastix strix TaxID=222440 RepID=A0A5J4TAS2_9EUKA|nr:MAG: hypothetical protein EZS28_049115 [Streblomastix strix]
MISTSVFNQFDNLLGRNLEQFCLENGDNADVNDEQPSVVAPPTPILNCYKSIVVQATSLDNPSAVQGPVYIDKSVCSGEING